MFRHCLILISVLLKTVCLTMFSWTIREEVLQFAMENPQCGFHMWNCMPQKSNSSKLKKIIWSSDKLSIHLFHPPQTVRWKPFDERFSLKECRHCRGVWADSTQIELISGVPNGWRCYHRPQRPFLRQVIQQKKSGAKKNRKKDKLGTELRFSLDFTSSLSVGVSNLEFHFEFQL